MLQILTSIIKITAVGVKITHEQQYSTDGDIHISPFLWVVIVTGWYLPMFVSITTGSINSLLHFIDLMSMLQDVSFSEAVFGDHSVISANEKANELVDTIGLTDAHYTISKQ